MPVVKEIIYSLFAEHINIILNYAKNMIPERNCTQLPYTPLYAFSLSCVVFAQRRNLFKKLPIWREHVNRLRWSNERNELVLVCTHERRGRKDPESRKNSHQLFRKLKQRTGQKIKKVLLFQWWLKATTQQHLIPFIFVFLREVVNFC